MTKSRRQKSLHRFGKEHGYIPAGKELDRVGNTPLNEKEHDMRLLLHCHKNIIVYPGELEEGDTVCLVKMRPKKIRRRKIKCSTWKVQYLDRANGFLQLGNTDSFDKERAEENISFIRSHNFNITDVWGLETAFTHFLLPRLKVFIESTRYGVPSNIYHQYLDEGYTSDEADKFAEKAWQDILIRMYEGLTLYVDGPDAKEIRTRITKEKNLKTQRELWDIEHKMEQDAQDLFSKWFFSLWD